MTNFAYNTGVPATNNDPSDDQPEMLINSQALAGPSPVAGGIIGVDHTSFNVVNGGQHKSIHFNQDASYVPTAPVSPPELFTESLGGKTVLKYYSGNAANTSNQYVVSGNNGSTIVMGGIIFKWFQKVLANGANAITFAGEGVASFPNNAFIAEVSSNLGSAISVSLLTTAGLTLTVSGTPTVHVLVIGN